MTFILTLQHRQCGLCCGVAVLWCHQELPRPLPCPPAHPHPLELGQSEGSGCSPIPQGCGSGATYPHPRAMLQLATQDPLKGGNVDRKREFKEQELKILHSALVLRAEESVLARKGGSGFEFGLAKQGCGEAGTMAGLCWGWGRSLFVFPHCTPRAGQGFILQPGKSIIYLETARARQCTKVSG